MYVHVDDFRLRDSEQHVARGFRNLKSCLRTAVHLICHILERLRDIPDITQKL